MRLWGAPQFRLEGERLEVEPAGDLHRWLSAAPGSDLGMLFTRLGIYKRGSLAIWNEKDREEAESWISSTPSFQRSVLQNALIHGSVANLIQASRRSLSQAPAIHQEELGQLMEVSRQEEGWRVPMTDTARSVDLHHPRSGMRVVIIRDQAEWQALLLDSVGKQFVTAGSGNPELMNTLRECSTRVISPLAPDDWCSPHYSRSPLLDTLRPPCALEWQQVLRQGVIGKAHRQSCFARPAFAAGSSLTAHKTRSWRQLMSRVTAAGLAHRKATPLPQRIPAKGRMFFFYRPQNPYQG